MLRKELSFIFKTARPVLRHQALDIKKAMTHEAHGHLIVITPRAIGNAPTRNLIRRRIKALFHENNLHKENVAWVFFVKKGASALSFAELQKLVVDAVGNR